MQTTTRIEIRDLRPLDWPEVAAIYVDGIATGNATFEVDVPSWEAWDRAHPELRLVASLDGRVAGFAALAPWSSRRCYRGVAEESVYVGEWARGRGVGRALLESLIERAEAAGIWTLNAGIFPENELSITLHRSCGFRVLGTQERVGESNGIWRDVVLLERRSEVVGR